MVYQILITTADEASLRLSDHYGSMMTSLGSARPRADPFKLCGMCPGRWRQTETFTVITSQTTLNTCFHLQGGLNFANRTKENAI